jgi:hypothetical protein
MQMQKSGGGTRWIAAIIAAFDRQHQAIILDATVRLGVCTETSPDHGPIVPNILQMSK